MTPKFQITVGGSNITSTIANRLLMLRVTDEAGIKADSVDLSLDDRDGQIAVPSMGATISVAMGYEERNLVPMGTYVASEITLAGDPQTISITGKSANMSGKLREQKSRTWSDITLKELVATIAADHEISPRIADRFATFKYDNIAQRDESDLHFLNRLSRDHDALFSVKGGSLLFGTRGLGFSLSGLLMPASTIYKSDVSSWRVTLADADEFGSVTAKWRQGSDGTVQTVKAGEASPAKALRNIFASKAEATAAAYAKLNELGRAGHRLSLTMPAKPQLSAESQITLSGFKSGADGTWSITSATHELRSGGFTTKIEAERPQI